MFLLLVLHLVILVLVMQFTRQQFQLQHLHSQSSLVASTMILWISLLFWQQKMTSLILNFFRRL